jgi:IrrE N-terminal-like domain
LSQGYKFVESAIVVRVLSGVVETVIARLDDQGVAGVPLFEEWEAIQQADDDEAQFCLAAARLGLDPYSEAGMFEEALVRAGRELNGTLLDDFLSAVNPQRLDAGLEWVSGARDAVNEAVGGQGSLLAMRDVVRRKIASPDRFPWRVGWQQARRVREALGLDIGARLDPSRYLISVARPSGDKRLQAVGGIGRNHRSPTVVVGSSSSDNARRFTLSRALWHFLAEDDLVFLVTASYTDRQRVERAFAAELLAPSEGIEQRLGSEVLSEEELEEIAEHFGVSVRVVEHQIQNQLMVDAA